MATTAKAAKTKRSLYIKRKARSNAKIKSQSFDIRIVVQRSNKFVSAQAIATGGNIVAAVTDALSKADTKTARAFEAGKMMADKLGDTSDKRIVFDRNGYLYHGRVKSFVEGLREGGVSL